MTMELNGSCMMIWYWSNSFSGAKNIFQLLPSLLFFINPFLPKNKCFHERHRGLCCLQEGCRQVLVGEELLGRRLGWKWQLGWIAMFDQKTRSLHPLENFNSRTLEICFFRLKTCFCFFFGGGCKIENLNMISPNSTAILYVSVQIELSSGGGGVEHVLLSPLFGEDSHFG